MSFSPSCVRSLGAVIQSVSSKDLHGTRVQAAYEVLQSRLMHTEHEGEGQATGSSSSSGGATTASGRTVKAGARQVASRSQQLLNLEALPRSITSVLTKARSGGSGSSGGGGKGWSSASPKRNKAAAAAAAAAIISGTSPASHPGGGSGVYSSQAKGGKRAYTRTPPSRELHPLLLHSLCMYERL